MARLGHFMREMFLPLRRWWASLVLDAVGVGGAWWVMVAIGRALPGQAWLWGVVGFVLAILGLAIAAGTRLQAEKDARGRPEFEVEALVLFRRGLEHVGGVRYQDITTLVGVVENLGPEATFTARIRQVTGLNPAELPGSAPYEVERVAWEDTFESSWSIVRGGKGRLVLWKVFRDPFALWAVTAKSASYGDGHLAGWRQRNPGDEVTFRLEVVNATLDTQKVWVGRIIFSDDRSVAAFTIGPAGNLRDPVT